MEKTNVPNYKLEKMNLIVLNFILITRKLKRLKMVKKEEQLSRMFMMESIW